MSSPRLRQEEKPAEFDAQAHMRELTTDFEQLRATLRGNKNWSEEEIEEILGSLALRALSFQEGLRKRRRERDQNYLRAQQRERRAQTGYLHNPLAGTR